MIPRCLALLDSAVERFLSAVVDRLVRAWGEEER